MPSRLQEMTNAKVDRNDLAISKKQEKRIPKITGKFSAWWMKQRICISSVYLKGNVLTKLN